MKWLSVPVAVAMVLASDAIADVPQMINYQARLTDTTGSPVPDADYQITFTVYDAAGGGNALWSSGLQMVTVKDGLFTYPLGSAVQLPSDLFSTDTLRWLGVKVEPDPEISPRPRLTTVPYAYEALRADTAAIALTGIGGSGTTGYIPKFTSSDDLGNSAIYETSGRIGIGTTSPNSNSKLHVASTSYYSGYFTSTRISNSTHVIHAEHTGSGQCQATAVYGKCIPNVGSGYGGFFEGGDVGVHGRVITTAGSGSLSFGVHGIAQGGSGTLYGVYGEGGVGSGTNYGVYGSGYGGTTSYGVYYAGGLAGSGSKSCVVKTSQGPTLLYCQESPESWFEDFGEGELINGKAHIKLDELFLETVTIDDAHPMKVFVQLEGDCNGVFVSKGATGFDVLELRGGTSNVPFSYRVVAKRKGFENRRLDFTAAGKDDPYLYPEAATRLVEEKPEGRNAR